MKDYKVGDTISLFDIRGLWTIIEIYSSKIWSFKHYRVTRTGCNDRWITRDQIAETMKNP